MMLPAPFDRVQIGRSLYLLAMAWAGAIAVGSLHAILPIGGAHGLAGPDLLLLTAVFAGFELRQPLVGTLALGIVLGYFGDLFAGSPKGMHMLAFASASWAARSAASLILVRGALSTLLVCLGFALGSSLVLLAVQLAFDANAEWRLLVCVPLAAVITAIFAPPWFWLLRRCDRGRAREPWLRLAG